MGCGSGFEGFGTRRCRPDAGSPEMDRIADPGANPEVYPLERPRRSAREADLDSNGLNCMILFCCVKRCRFVNVAAGRLPAYVIWCPPAPDARF